MRYFQVLEKPQGRTVIHRRDLNDAKVWRLYRQGRIKEMTPIGDDVELKFKGDA